MDKKTATVVEAERALLRREKIPLPPQDVVERLLAELPPANNLADEAAEVLGYIAYRDDAASKKTEVRRLQFLTALAGIIAPFNREGVETYKKSKAERMTREVQREQPGLSEFLFIFLTTLAVGALGFCILPNGVHNKIDLVRGILGVFLEFSALVLFVGGVLSLAEIPIRTFSWVRRPISQVKDKIPPEAIELGIRIKKECPGAEIFVDSLEEQRRVADPILVVKFEGKGPDFYVEAWDEDGFMVPRKPVAVPSVDVTV